MEIYGPESSGKTTLVLHTIAEAQKKGGICAFVDAEHALDVVYARKLGVNTDDLLISQPDAGEQALEIAETLVRSGAIDVLVVDSVAALVPRSELEGEMGDVQPGTQARLMSQALRKLTASISKSRTMVVFINQIRMKIGVMYGSPETTPGGNALKFYASVRLDIRRIGAIKDRDEVVGNQTRVKVVKNKLAPPFKQVEFDIMYGEGVSKLGELIDLGVKAGSIGQSKEWTTAALLGQMQMTKEQAEAAGKLLGLPADAVLLLQQVPYKGSLPTAVPTDPLIYRFYEIVSVYGTTFKELIHEEFGDGIMSAIDFKMDHHARGRSRRATA